MIELNLPIDVRRDDAWVCVKSDSKVPFQSGKFKAASPSDTSTWSSFESAVNDVYSGKYDYVGYCFHDNGIVGIDIDDGFDEDGFLSELAVDIINACKSYTEYSRSGRGVHILVRGNLDFKGANNRAGVEIYRTGRYFIMTGKKLIYDTMIDNQESIDYIVTKYFPVVDKTSSAGNYKDTIYKPVKKFVKGKMVTEFPPIPDGCRNISLTSYAGQLRTSGADENTIRESLKKVNKIACTPPLPDNEIEGIIKSVMRYKCEKKK